MFVAPVWLFGSEQAGLRALAFALGAFLLAVIADGFRRGQIDAGVAFGREENSAAFGLFVVLYSMVAVAMAYVVLFT